MKISHAHPPQSQMFTAGRKLHVQKDVDVMLSDDESDDDVDEDQPHPSTTTSAVCRWKKAACTKRHNVDDDESDDDVDGKERPTKPKRRSTATKGKYEKNDDDGAASKVHQKRPWSVEERDAVKRSMAKFIALWKVPAKSDCLVCL